MRWFGCIAVTLFLTAATSFAAVGIQPQMALQRFQADYPQTLLYSDGGKISRVWGEPFGSGNSPEEVAATFVQNYSPMLGVAPEDLVPGNHFNDLVTLPMMYDEAVGDYRLVLLYYAQYSDGVPVFEGDLRLLVRNEPGYPLVWVGNSLHDLGDFVVPAGVANQPAGNIGHDAALALIPDLVQFTPSEYVVYPGTPGKLGQPPRLAVKFIADNGLPATADYVKHLFLADALTGAILLDRDMIIATNVTGSVHGQATTLPKSAECNPEVDTVMPWAKVAIGTTTAYADASGNFTITNSGTSAVTVTSYMSGSHFSVSDQGGTLETLTTSVTPPGPANFMHNSANTSEYIRAEVNAYVQANVVRDWILTYCPTYPTISGSAIFPLNVNINSTCNAYYDYSSLNFYRNGGGCANSAYSNVVHHEYGHHVVNCAGSAQDQWGEGVGDTCAMLIADDPILGYGFELNCNAGIRTAVNTMQYPCSSDIHTCAQLLSGTIWSTRNLLVTGYPSTYKAILSNLFVNAQLLHDDTGTIGPDLYADFVTLDNSYYAGAHLTEITNGFSAHNMVPAPPPANDAAANAIVACPGSPQTGTTNGATMDGSASCDGSSPGPDVWYKYLPASSGSATFSLCSSGTTWDSVISVHSGSPGTTSNQLGCADDTCGGTGTHGTLTLTVTGGSTYYIRIGGYASSNIGPFTLTVTGPACGTVNYTLTTNVTGSGSIALDPTGGTYASGTVVTCTANAASGWHFVSWSGDLSGSTNPTTITMNGNKSITANFAQDTYTLTVNVSGSGSVTKVPDQISYPSGTNVQLTANGASGWHFDHWSGDLTGSTNPTTITMSSNKTVTATFVPDQFTLTVNVVGSGSVDLNPPGGTYSSGTNVELTANATAGWRFDHWSGDLSGSANPTNIVMGASHSVTATFTLLGDMNCDGVVNNQDIDPFVLALFNPAGYAATYPSCYLLNADFTGDGAVNNQDIDGFVAALFSN